ncbi:MAG: hypothetical protein ACE5HM_09345, partial [Acidiferrobacterales bacterium]
DKSGAWYSYNKDRIGQGKDNARQFLKENPEIAAEIEGRIRDTLNIGRRTDLDADVDALEAEEAGA